MQPARRLTLYQQIEALPEGLTGELIDGQIHTQPRPAGPHANAASVLGMDIGSAYHRGRGGPGGWWIIMEPEVHFIRDVEVLVPDLAGWQRSRMASIPRDQRFTVIPDWVCEVLSPGTESKDRRIKMPLYARYGVAYAWLVDPLARTLEAWENRNGQWIALGLFRNGQTVCVAPFAALTIWLADLWC